MDEFEINTPKRQAAFLAQIAHESAGLQYVRELWGPTTAQLAYEGRQDLGNTEHGDGYRYRGHGLIQVTGRANHVSCRDDLRARGLNCPDFEETPEALMVPKWAAMSAGWFWDEKSLNALADVDDFQRITKRINGGLNGYGERVVLWNRAQESLGERHA
jgi:putative chitinase